MMIDANARLAARWKWAVALACIGAFIAIAIYFKLPHLLRELLRSVLAWIQGLGPWGPVIFIAIYVVACVLLVPASVFTLGAGILFGVVRGSLYTSIAATLGATASFVIGRYLARDWVAHKIEGHPTFAAIDKAVAAEGWKIVGLTRLAPIFPFAFLNYGFSVTRVSLRDFFFASAIAMIPGTVMYVYFGSLIGDLARLDKGVQSPPVVKWIIGILIVVTTTYLIRFARKALAQKISDQRPLKP